MGERNASKIGLVIVSSMRGVAQRKKFINDLKRQESRGKNPEKLFAVVRILAQEGRLPTHLRPHKLSGEYKGLWECHIEHNWLLIYDVSDTKVLLIRTGPHADLF